MKLRMGCLLPFAILGIGLLIGYGIRWIEDAKTPYVDQATAAGYARAYAEDLCGRGLYRRPVDCKHYRLTASQENKDGWWFSLLSDDGRRSVDMIVERQGKTEAENPTDLDDPNVPPAKTVIGHVQSPPPEKPSGNSALH